ncbi:hypothetical protein ICL16_05490 [Iningainema sp. BLCCT55]|uniref:Uncharacterized protein n=1 Tax=Iningainema tapete BLCC-T55 TaxID=2748662 RepID=A0A8J6XGI6_9CYAN|nr:hypothetical protein [Iningainema tapete BLCC-T55]
MSNDNSNKLQQLLEWCKIIHACLDSHQVDDAKFFLEQAITPSRKIQLGRLAIFLRQSFWFDR